MNICHENKKLYCNFYTNEQECPFGDNCIFIHENSENCKYEGLFERSNCMHRHITIDEEAHNTDVDCDIDDKIEDDSDNAIDGDGDMDEDREAVDDTEIIFYNPC